jgi:hypothetical protein
MKTAPTPTLEGPGTRAFSENLVCDMESGIEDADNNHLVSRIHLSGFYAAFPCYHRHGLYLSFALFF